MATESNLALTTPRTRGVMLRTPARRHHGADAAVEVQDVQDVGEPEGQPDEQPDDDHPRSAPAQDPADGSVQDPAVGSGAALEALRNQLAHGSGEWITAWLAQNLAPRDVHRRGPQRRPDTDAAELAAAIALESARLQLERDAREAARRQHDLSRSVQNYRAMGATWEDVGRLFGISRQAAAKRFSGSDAGRNQDGSPA